MNGLNISTELLAVIITVASIIVTTIILLISRRRKRGKVVTLIGLCDAGKTLLLSRVRYFNKINVLENSIIITWCVDSERKVREDLHQHD